MLLDVDNINNMVQYFMILYKQRTLFEVRGVKINATLCQQFCSYSSKSSSTTPSHISTFVSTNDQQCRMWLYALCFSTIKACSYWNTETLAAIVEGANLMYRYESEFWCGILPGSINILGGNVNIVFYHHKIPRKIGHLLCFE